MQIGKVLFTTNTHRLVHVFFNEGDCGYKEDDKKSYYGFTSLSSYIPYSDNIGTKESLIKRLEMISKKNSNPSYLQMKEWIAQHL